MYTVFTKPNCPFCVQAKALLLNKKLPFSEVHLFTGQQHEQGLQYITREELIAKIPSAKTMPQIMEGDRLIGGFVELKKELNEIV